MFCFQAWQTVDNDTKFTAEKYFGCCGFENSTIDG
jgi:hypothetical protein